MADLEPLTAAEREELRSESETLLAIEHAEGWSGHDIAAAKGTTDG